jgi:hypothetical protein
MSALPSLSQSEQSARYEQYVRENWDRMSPSEQDQARSYFQAKQQAESQPNLYAVSAQGTYGGGYGAYSQPGYGGAFAPIATPQKAQGGAWALWVGYPALFFFTPLAFGCGIYNLVKGRPVHGVVQMVLAVFSAILGVMMVMSGSS